MVFSNNSIWNIQLWFEENSNAWVLLLISFVIAEFINVVLSTIKSVVLIRGTKQSATIVNTISYTISAFVTAIIGSVVNNVWLVCLVVFITNSIGVWLGLTIVDKFRKDRVWKISATVKTDDFHNLIHELHVNKISFITYETSWPERKPLDVFSKSREQSLSIKTIFKKYDVKYIISENNNVL